MSKSYEIEPVYFDPKSRFPNEYHLVCFCTLTGMSRQEVWDAWPEKYRKHGGWGGARHVDAARALGFNCTNKFKKFDPATPWPCILRVQVPAAWGWKNNNWWRLTYNQGTIYNPVPEDPNSPFDPTCGWHTATLEEFYQAYPGCRITSMLQVWMDDKLVFTAKDF